MVLTGSVIHRFDVVVDFCVRLSVTEKVLGDQGILERESWSGGRFDAAHQVSLSSVP